MRAARPHLLVALIAIGATVGGGCESSPDAPSRCPVPQNYEDRSRGGFYPYAALPRGACTSAGFTCTLGVSGPCGDDPEYVGHPYNLYECRCSAGTWTCRVVSQGASICLNRDAGVG